MLQTTAIALHVAVALQLASGNSPADDGVGPRGGNKGRGHNCFLRGTSIRTPQGEARIEDLKIGDLVETVRGEAAAIKWIGRRAYKKAGPSWDDSIRVKELVNEISIAPALPAECEGIEYLQIVLETHEVMIWAEVLLPSPSSRTLLRAPVSCPLASCYDTFRAYRGLRRWTRTPGPVALWLVGALACADRRQIQGRSASVLGGLG
ncbi:Hint domain-containing protein (plasmid) [Phyllobacterium sp. A18/5-2]|nr:Hint domain-containing protein [Phyllobacterium sp. A18/5-2]